MSRKRGLSEGRRLVADAKVGRCVAHFLYELSVSHSEVLTNARELIKQASLPDELPFRLEVGDIRHPERLDAFLGETQRRVHNLLASIYASEERTTAALTSLARRIRDGRKRVEEQQAAFGQFRSSELASLMANIRGRGTHVEPLDLRWTNQITEVNRPSQRWVHFVHFNARQLKRLRIQSERTEEGSLGVAALAAEYVAAYTGLAHKLERNLRAEFASDIAEWEASRPQRATWPEPEAPRGSSC